MNHKCDGTCIYFPQIGEEINFYYDCMGVKRKCDSSPYICLYNNKKITFKTDCKHFKSLKDVKKGDIFNECYV